MTTYDPWTFALMTPDAIVADVHAFILQRIAEHGFEVRACRLMGFDVDRMRRMYHHSHHPPPPSGAPNELPPDVMARLYALTPACLLLLRHRAGMASAAIARCKGVTLPEQAAPDSVRRAGENGTLNFMHAPDAGDAPVELDFLLAPGETTALTQMAQADEAPAVAAFAVAALTDCLPAFSGPRAISFPWVANRVRCRIAQLLAIVLHDDGAAVHALNAAVGALAEERRLLAASDTAMDRLAIAQRANAGIHAPLRIAAQSATARLPSAAHACGEALAGLSSLLTLSDPLIGASSQLPSVVPLLKLANAGVYLPPLEGV